MFTEQEGFSSQLIDRKLENSTFVSGENIRDMRNRIKQALQEKKMKEFNSKILKSEMRGGLSSDARSQLHSSMQMSQKRGNRMKVISVTATRSKLKSSEISKYLKQKDFLRSNLLAASSTNELSDRNQLGKWESRDLHQSSVKLNNDSTFMEYMDA